MTLSQFIVKDVSKNFSNGSEELQVLKAISATFTQGQTYAIFGPSGSGKSTLLHMLAGFEQPSCGGIFFQQMSVVAPGLEDSGTVLCSNQKVVNKEILEGEVVKHSSLHDGVEGISRDSHDVQGAKKELSVVEKNILGNSLVPARAISLWTAQEKSVWWNSSIGMVFQQPFLIEELSVIENVIIKGLIKGLSYDLCCEKAYSMLKVTGLLEKRDSSPATLSGGQQQRVAIVRAIFNEPVFLLADEPTGNLDRATAKVLIDFLLDCHKEWGMGIIVTTHEERFAEKVGNVLRLEGGQLLVGL